MHNLGPRCCLPWQPSPQTLGARGPCKKLKTSLEFNELGVQLFHVPLKETT